MALGVVAAVPGAAQVTTVTTIKYAATSSSAGVTLAVTPPGAPAPAAGVFGAGTRAEVSSDGPSASGKADALAVLTQSPVTADTKAPPDEEKTANSPLQVINVPGVGTIGGLQGTASSTSEAKDETPSTANTATFGAVKVSLGALPALPVLGTVGGTINVADMRTTSDAEAPKPTTVLANAASDGVVVSADLDISGLSAVCGLIPIPQLQQACNSLATPSQLISVTAGPSDVLCSWDGRNADCDGGASSATITLAGQAPVVVQPGQEVVIPPTGEQFLVRVRAGTFSETVDGDQGSAISTGISVELIGTARANPGLITVAIGQSTAGVNGEITTERTTAPTGGGLLPFFLGGSALAAGGFGLRRYLKRR